MNDEIRIPQSVLDEQWFGFVHKLLEQMQRSFRVAQVNQKQIAARLGKKPSFISRCLSGQQNMTIRTIHDLARAMDCRLEFSFRPLSSLMPVNQPAAIVSESSLRTGTKASTYKKALENDLHA
jgi:transcriptional regulator with XRE-family HTH domain